jgi:hypothetical protein
MKRRLLLQSLGASTWSAILNGEVVAASTDVSEPFPVPYPSMMGKPDELRAWTVPAGLLREGRNTLEVSLHNGPSCSVLFVDLDVVA